MASGTWNWGTVPWGDVGLVKWASSETYFVHHNVLESSTMATDHAGAVQQDLLYYPWGQAWTTPTVDGTYASMRTLVATAGEETLVTPNRFYSATYGRWLSPDPLAGDVTNPQSLNRYAYALNNPVTFTDPLGLGDCGGDPTFDCNGPNPGKPPDPQGNWPGGGGGGVTLSTNPASDCSYTMSNDASCSNPAGLWSNGTPIYGGTGGGLNIGIWGGNGGIWSEAVPPFSGGGFGLPCDFGTCGGTTGDYFVSNAAQVPGPCDPTDLNGAPCFVIFVTTSATLGGSIPSVPGANSDPTLQSGYHPSRRYGDYVGCLWNELVTKNIADPDKAGVITAVNIAPFWKRGGALYFIPAAIFDLSLEFGARAACSEQVYGGR